MKKSFEEIIEIPDGISCSISGQVLKCSLGSLTVEKLISLPNIYISINDGKILLSSKGSKKELKIIKSYSAHIKNIFLGLKKPFVYKLEACNVHFPITLKLEKKRLIINNFLGEKVPRAADILFGVSIDIKGQKITLSSYDKSSAGQTAANIEKATKIKNRDRRIFQDGIFIVEKPGKSI